MGNFDYEISNITRELTNLVNNMTQSSLVQATTIMQANISGNIQTHNIQSNNINTDNINTLNLNTNALNSDQLTIKNDIKIQNKDCFPELSLNNLGIFSIINNNKNALIMLETIKNLLIESGYFTEEKFSNEYDKMEQKIDDMINGEKVANKLMEN